MHTRSGRCSSVTRFNTLHDPAHPVFHRPVLSAAVGCCGQSKGTVARGKANGADQRVKAAGIFPCVLLSWTTKTVKHINAVRETAMGSRSPAGPRRLGTATRISASLFRRLSAFFGSTPRPRPKSGKVRRSDTRPGDVRERAVCVEGNDSAPVRNVPCFAV